MAKTILKKVHGYGEHTGETLTFGCTACIKIVHEGQRRAKLMEQNPDEAKEIYIEKVLYVECPHCNFKIHADFFLISHEDDLIEKLTIKINDRRFCSREDCGKETYLDDGSR